jgi:hypothetical protein
LQATILEFTTRCSRLQEAGSHGEGLAYTDSISVQSLKADECYWLWRAFFLEQIRGPDDAERCLTEGLGLLGHSRNSNELSEALGRRLMRRHAYREARIVLSGAVKCGGSEAIQILLARALLGMGAVSEALELAEGVQANRRDAGAWQLIMVEARLATARASRTAGADLGIADLLGVSRKLWGQMSREHRLKACELDHLARIQLGSGLAEAIGPPLRMYPALMGRILPVVHWFQGENRPWTELQRSAMTAALKRALSWLHRSAQFYGVGVEFLDCLDLGSSSHPLEAIPVGSGGGDEFGGWAELASRRCGCASLSEFRKSLIAEFRCQQIFLVAMIETDGRAYACPVFDVGSESSGVPAVAAYRTFNGHHGHDAVFAHEILHLFGARDLYEMFEISEQQARTAKVAIPGEIMHECWEPLERLHVCELTAYRVGWSTRWQPWFCEFEPLRAGMVPK